MNICPFINFPNDPFENKGDCELENPTGGECAHQWIDPDWTKCPIIKAHQRETEVMIRIQEALHGA